MPEAAVHEDARAVFGQDDVRCPGQCADTFAEPVSPLPQFTPDYLFGSCVLRVYAGHAIVALFGCHAVRHGSMSSIIYLAGIYLCQSVRMPLPSGQESLCVRMIILHYG